jgi:hypothetical protein
MNCSLSESGTQERNNIVKAVLLRYLSHTVICFLLSLRTLKLLIFDCFIFKRKAKNSYAS